jgi:hypothetical protein
MIAADHDIVFSPGPFYWKDGLAVEDIAQNKLCM